MSPRKVVRDSGRASLTLLEAGHSNVMDDLKANWPVHLDIEGLGIEDDFVKKAPSSPTSPLSKAVSKNAISQPGVAVVHRVRLRDFDEGKPESRMVTRRHSTGCLSGTSDK